MLQTFTWRTPGGGSFWRDLGGQATAMADAGYTHLWCPPPCKAAGGADDRGYGLYDLYDLGEHDQKGSVRTRYGTAEELKDAVASLNDAGLVPIADVVLNHRMGADRQETFEVQEVAMHDRTRDVGDRFELTAWTAYDFPGRLQGAEAAGGVESPGENDFRWRWHHFTAVDQKPEGDESERPRLFRISSKAFEEAVDLENGNADFLMGCDVDLDQADVRVELSRWGDWFLNQTGFAGFRFDAAKHMSRGFLRGFLDHARREGADLFAVSEYGSGDPEAIRSFLDLTGGRTRAFDFPLHYAFAAAGAAMNGDGPLDLTTLFTGTVAETHPDLAVTFVDNHDSDPAQEVGGWVADAFKPHAYASVLLRAGGLPCVYAGDVGFLEGGAADGETAALTDHAAVVGRLIDARRRFAFGPQEELAVEAGHRAWIRRGTADHPGVMVVVINASDEPVTVGAQTGRVGEAFRELVRPDAGAEARVADDGRAGFACPARDIAVWAC